MSNQQSHSELFGLKGQDNPGFPSDEGKTQAPPRESIADGHVEGEGPPPKEGHGDLGGAGHPTGAAAGGPDARGPEAQKAGQASEKSVGGMSTGSSDGAVPGSGGSLTKPSQGSGEVANEQRSTGDILNPKT